MEALYRQTSNGLNQFKVLVDDYLKLFQILLERTLVIPERSCEVYNPLVTPIVVACRIYMILFVEVMELPTIPHAMRVVVICMKITR